MTGSATFVAPNALEQSYKAREIEGRLDILFYRPVGLRLARLFAACRLTPSQVTIIGSLIGIVGAHFYCYQSLALNLLGILLHLTADLFDSADGQLARLTRQQSDEGRVLDGVGTYLIYVSVYVHLCARYIAEGGSRYIIIAGVAAALSHSCQSMILEFWRDAYAHFVSRKMPNMDDPRELAQERERARWRETPLRKLLLVFHVGYVEQQDRTLPALAQLRDRARQIFRGNVPASFSAAYAQVTRRLLRFASLLGNNIRTILLFSVVLIGRPIWFVWIEFTLLNAVFVWLVVRQNRASKQLLPLLDGSAQTA